MTSIGKWNAPVGTTIFTTGLDALTGTTPATSSAINNDTDLYLYADLELVLGALSPTAGATINLYLVQALDGSNYPAPSAADLRLSSTLFGWDFTWYSCRDSAENFCSWASHPPSKFKIILDNQAGVNLAGSGNTLKMSQYNLNLNGS